MLEQVGRGIRDDVFGSLGVREDTRHELPRLATIEEAHGQLLNVPVQLIAHVADHALAHLHPKHLGCVEEGVLEEQSDHHDDDYIAERL